MLIAVAHGSRNAEWRASVERVVQSLAPELGADAVRLAYMECTPPTLRDIVAEAAGKGIARVRVLPLFLADEGHVDRDIRPLVDDLRVAFKDLEVELMPAIGQHPLFRTLLHHIAAEQP